MWAQANNLDELFSELLKLFQVGPFFSECSRKYVNLVLKAKLDAMD